MSNKILIISPHPDDLEIGMGGTAAKLVDSGHNIYSLVVTDGRNSTNLLGISPDDLIELRKKEVESSSELLGIKELIYFGLHDVKSDKNKDCYTRKLLELIQEINPDEIYIPHPEFDKHHTHKIVSKIVINCLKENEIKCECWCYEVWTSFPHYDRLEDISLFVDKKMAAIGEHKSQIDYKDYINGIVGLNRYRAVFNDFFSSDDVQYAEAFINYNSELFYLGI